MNSQAGTGFIFLFLAPSFLPSESERKRRKPLLSCSSC